MQGSAAFDRGVDCSCEFGVLERGVTWLAVFPAIAAAALIAAAGSLLLPDFGPAQIVNALSPPLSVIAILCAVAAVRGRARRSAAFLVIAAAAFASPPIAAVHRAEETAPTPNGSRLRVISFNAFRDNPDGAGAARALAALGGDVLLLQEAGGLGERGLAILARLYPHHSACRPGCDLAIYARVPMERPRWRFRDDAGSPTGARLVQATVRSAGGRAFSVVAVHLARPYRDSQAARAELDELAQTLTRRAGPGTILAGDFNRAPWSAGMRGFEQAIALRRAPSFRATWPADLRAAGIALPALAPIDHVFAGPEWLFADGMRAVRLPGSDHRAVVVDLTPVMRLDPPGASARQAAGPAPGPPH